MSNNIRYTGVLTWLEQQRPPQKKKKKKPRWLVSQWISLSASWLMLNVSTNDGITVSPMIMNQDICYFILGSNVLTKAIHKHIYTETYVFRDSEEVRQYVPGMRQTQEVERSYVLSYSRSRVYGKLHEAIHRQILPLVTYLL